MQIWANQVFLPALYFSLNEGMEILTKVISPMNLSVSVPLCWMSWDLLCLQAEGGKRAGAVATVVAAVDLARVRQPALVEGGRAEEDEAVEVDLRQQAAAMAADQSYQAALTSTRVQSGHMLFTAQEFTREAAVLQPQVS